MLTLWRSVVQFCSAPLVRFPTALDTNVADEREFFTPEYFSDLWSRKRPPVRPSSQNNGGGAQRRRWGLGRGRKQESE